MADGAAQSLKPQLDQVLQELARAQKDLVDEAARRDLDKMQGTWTATAFTVDGQPVPEKELKTIKLVIAGDQSTFTRGDKTGKGTYKLDPTRKPRTLDIVLAEGPDKENIELAIYKLEGDRLEICLGGTRERPTELASKAGSGHVLEVWKREKP